MGYVHVSASFKSIALAWPSSAWDMFAMRNFASNKVFCEAKAIWKVQRKSLRTISLKWSSASKGCSFRIFWTDFNLVWNVITKCAVNRVFLYYIVVHFTYVLQQAHLHLWSLSGEELPCLLCLGAGTMVIKRYSLYCQSDSVWRFGWMSHIWGSVLSGCYVSEVRSASSWFFSIYKFIFRLPFSRWTWCLGIIKRKLNVFWPVNECWE